MQKRASIILVLLFSLTIALVGCGQDSGETPEQAVTNALTAVQNLDQDTAEKYFRYEDLITSDSESEEFMEDEETVKLMFDKLDFKIVSSSIEDDTAIVETEITNIDLTTIIIEYIQQAMTVAFEYAFAGDDAPSDAEMEEQMEILFIEMLQDEDSKTVTTTVDIHLTKNADSWKLTIDETLQDALFGGLISGIQEVEDSFAEEN